MTAKTRYRNWLIRKVNRFGDRSYRELLIELDDIEYYYDVFHDDARAQDGVYNRWLWIDAVKYEGDNQWGPCSMLEFLYGMTLRMDFLAEWRYRDDGLDVIDAFWILIENLGLGEYSGKLTQKDCDEVTKICDAFCHRTKYDGKYVEMFPIEAQNAKFRRTERFVQMQLFVRERWPRPFDLGVL